VAKNEGIISIHGKDYATVAYRLELFREDHPGGCITTTIVKDEDGIIIMRATILDNCDNVLGSDYAEEVRGSSNINETSALENCSTSAVGRALAFAGYNKSGTSVASADEVSVAIARQKRDCDVAKKTLKVLDERITEKQMAALGFYLDSRNDGDVRMTKILDRAEIDNLRELTKQQAAKCIDTWGIQI
jgi:hypothetical protein